MKLTVKVFEDDAEVSISEFQVGTYVVGRSEECDLVLRGEKVSRKHLEIRVTESSVYLSNLSSSGKVFVNGDALETAEVNSGDGIQIGHYRLVMSFGTALDNIVEPQMSSLPGGELIGDPNPEFPGEPEPNLNPEPEPLDPLGEENQSPLEPFDSPGADAQPQMDTPAPAFDGTAALNMSETQVQVKPLVAKLIFTQGPNNEQEFFLESYEVTFGRSRRADIYIDDEKLSRIHAKISRVGGGYRLIDLGSRNGTYVNGMRVLEHPLNSFDEISLGKSKIKFLIHDVAAQLGAAASGTASGLQPIDETKSVQVNPEEQAEILRQFQGEAPPPIAGLPSIGKIPFPFKGGKKSSNLTKILLLGVVAGLVLLFMMPSDQPATEVGPTAEAETTPGDDSGLPSSVSKEFMGLSDAAQRAIEGSYQSAMRAAGNKQFEDAFFHIKQIHDRVGSYKNSRELADEYTRKIEAKKVELAQRRAESDDKQDLQIFLNEGLQYLKEGNFDRAADAFNSAIIIAPDNRTASKGLEAAKKKVTDINKIPPDVDPEQVKRERVQELFKSAIGAFKAKSYQEAIDIAEQIRKIELKGESKYLSEAKQIIDLARMQQKEEFEPFLIQAREKYAEGDYATSRDLCEEMVKRDPAYQDAVDLLKKVKRQMNTLAKEAYIHGYILESMNKLDDAVQYWKRARQYVRPGDKYYKKVNKKLEMYR